MFSCLKKRQARRDNQALIVSSFAPPYRAQAQALAERLAKHADFTRYRWSSREQVRHTGVSAPLLGWMLLGEYGLQDGSPITQTMLHCLYSCHADGHVRERHLRALAQSDYPDMTMPFVVQSFGNWVREIHMAAFEMLVKRQESFAAFVHTNPEAWQTAKNRAASYWDIYYRAEDGHPWRQSQTYLRIRTLNEVIRRWS